MGSRSPPERGKVYEGNSAAQSADHGNRLQWGRALLALAEGLCLRITLMV